MNDFVSRISTPDIWRATTFDSVLQSGKTLPLIVLCERSREGGESETRRFVTKAIGHPGVSETDLFAELFGNLLAQHFGLTTCEPHIVAFNEDFVAATAPLLPAKIQLRPGYGVGCFFDPPLNPVVGDFKVPAELLPQAAALYAFDLLCVNDDRKRTNSNCALRAGQLIAFDFNQAFGFLHATYKPPSWKVASNGLAPSHICRPTLRNAPPNWKGFLDALKLLDAPALTALVKDFPLAWRVHFGEVVDHLLAAQDKCKQLEIELQKSLTI